MKNKQKLADAQRKLRELEKKFQDLRAHTQSDPKMRETMRTVKKLINQLKEEIGE